ncbi:P-loop containing nucleoside triphosphate hydrolase protein [Hyaloscypha bicolor E]|uniref:P-loop containing nucleoside triphosphate hydrolase protein n=1 Tax=Hyaloscypha bicolor E TaxID=1095630 RepID=A0A2J6TLY8_9HELO|nr:P-loop containing nucleoside triphosphate hydrolase protein [Hyaloscypha bicolor E]PMD64044.1 P-loop containing nucleoside triphosphate hydrolase protein [Hyaloscypha bicolor E]
MSSDEFVHVSTGHGGGPNPYSSVSEDFFNNTKGDRQYTEGYITASIRQKHPKYHLTISTGYNLNLLGFADSRADATYTPHIDAKETLVERQFMPPARRYNDELGGAFVDKVVFACYDYTFKGNQFLVYIVDGHDGPYHPPPYHYILTEDSKEDNQASAQKKTDELLAEASKWSQDLHGEVYVFDQGFWQKNRELWQNIQKSNWEDVILEKEKKEAIIEDVIGFFDSESRYSEFGVPWKRGVIFYGPPGNGKTISTKALMHDISKRTSPAIESLYVKTFNSFQGPEYGIRQIFLMARRMAPCLLVFEDIDSLVSPMVRSYFLNEVDGLESNHGILMIGSTNHLEQLDPGIAKRPSRFDRKYLFDVPTREERIQFADITGDFSFAYMKEAFVAALLVIVARTDEKRRFRHREDDLSDNILWKELKKQVEALRKEMEDESDNVASPSMSGMWPALNSIFDEHRARPIDINSAMPRYF